MASDRSGGRSSADHPLFHVCLALGASCGRVSAHDWHVVGIRRAVCPGALPGSVAYACLAPRNTLWAVKTAQIGRFLFAICVVVFGLAHFFALSETTSMVPKWIPPGQRFWALATGVAHLLAGVAILTGILAVLASRLFTAMLITFGALVWAPSLFADPHAHFAWAGNAMNLALAGAAWVVADSIRESAQPGPGEQGAAA